MSCLKSILWILLGLNLTLFSNENVKKTFVSRVEIVGLNPNLVSEIKPYLKIKSGDLFDEGELIEASKRVEDYLKKNQFVNAQVRIKAEEDLGQPFQKVVYASIELGQKHQLLFKGNTVLSDSTLRELIHPDLAGTSDFSGKIKQVVEKRYKSLGYHFASVNVTQESLLINRTLLIKINIVEGNKVFIDTVVFDGVWREDLPSPQKLFFENASGVLSRRLFWEEGISESTSNLLNKLRRMGFLSVSITGPRVFFSEDKKGVQLFYDIQLGKLYLIKKISFVGNESLSADELRKSLSLKIDTPVDRLQVSDALGQLKRLVRSRGFLDVNISSEEKLFEFESGQSFEGVELVVNVTEGPQYRVGTVMFEGLKKTQEKVVKREVILNSGDVFDPDKISQSEDNLSLLGLFGRVEAVTSSSAQSPLVKNIVFVLSEIKPGFGEVGIGGLYEDPLFRARTFLGLGYRNLFGLNQTASLRSEVSLPISRSDVLIPFVEYAAIVNYRAPYFIDLPLAFAVQGGFDSFQVASSADGRKSDLQTKARIEERLERRLSRHFLFQYRLHRLERTRTEVLERPEGGKTQTLNDTVDRIGSTGFFLWADYRNDLFNPTSGSIHTLDFEFAHPQLLSNSELSFLVALQRNSFYFPISKKLSFAVFSGGGWARALLNKGLPEARLANELALGGQGSIRGYAPRLFRAPLGTRELAFYNIRSELSFPLFGDVSGAVFFDTGQLFPELKPEARNDGVGVGVRYKTPVGPVVLDLAHGLSPAAESMVRFTFTVGSI